MKIEHSVSGKTILCRCMESDAEHKSNSKDHDFATWRASGGISQNPTRSVSWHENDNWHVIFVVMPRHGLLDAAAWSLVL